MHSIQKMTLVEQIIRCGLEEVIWIIRAFKSVYLIRELLVDNSGLVIFQAGESFMIRANKGIKVFWEMDKFCVTVEKDSIW